MRRLFISVFLLTLLLNILSFFILPDEVAVHFGQGGRPDSWGSKSTHVAMLLLFDVFMFVLFYSIPSLVMKSPKWLVSLPYKDVWLREENKELLRTKLEILTSEFGVGLFAFLFAITALSIQANLSDPVRLNERVFFTFFFAFMAYTVFWCVKLARSLARPMVSTTHSAISDRDVSQE